MEGGICDCSQKTPEKGGPPLARLDCPWNLMLVSTIFTPSSKFQS
jgi:hypothetical protein